MRNRFSVLIVFFPWMALLISLWPAGGDQTKAEQTASEANDGERVEVRLARAHVELAKLDVERALTANKQVPNLFSPERIEKLRLHVVIDEASLEQCLKGQDADPHEVCIRSAEAALKIAEVDLRAKRAARQRMPSAVGPLEIARATTVVRIAKLNLEMVRQLDSSDSVTTHLQWQIDDLRHQVLELRMRNSNRGYPF